MKFKFLKAILYTIIISLLLGITAFAKESNETVDEAQRFIDGILAYKCHEENVSSVQELVDTYLTENAGVSSDWYVIGLSQYKNYSFENYKSELLEHIRLNEETSASTRERFALALIAIGNDSEEITNILNSSIGEQGIMSWVYGLHILNNGYTSNKYTLDEVIDNILSMQLSDGGWALTGENSDVDVTAMMLQSLAPNYDDEKVSVAVEKALNLLSVRQKDNGDFSSYGVNNPESAAQVLVALSSLGIDCKTDDRFIKNGNDIFDSIARFELENGSFCHKIGGSANGNATVQVFYSMVSYIRMIYDKSPLYIFTNDDFDFPVSDSLAVSSNPVDYESGDTAEDIQVKNNESSNYKLWICAGIFSISLLLSVIMLVMKKRNKQNYICIWIVTAILILAVCFINIETKEEHDANITESKENVYGNVSITISCDVLNGIAAESYIPSNGIILESFKVDIEEGDTVYDALLLAVTKNGIHLETNGNNDSVYVEGIAHVYEFDYGDLSGWTYLVNGKKPSVSCGGYILNPDDVITWEYTLTVD